MAIEGFSEREVSANGLRLWIAEGRADGRLPLLLLHGLFDRWESWQPVMWVLMEHYHVIAPDLRGHGRSHGPQTGYELQDYAADSVALLDTLGLDRVAVVGHSLGALAGAVLAAEYPDRVRALVLEDPPLERTEATVQWLETLLDAKRRSEAETYAILSELYWYRDEEDWQRATEELRGTADGPFVALLTGNDVQADPFEVLGRIMCPVLLLQGDPRAGGALGDPLAERVMGALRRGRCRRFPDTGHAIHHERPDEFVAAVHDFLRE